MWSGNGTSFHAVAVAVFALFVVLPMLPITPPPLLPPRGFPLVPPLPRTLPLPFPETGSGCMVIGIDCVAKATPATLPASLD